VEKLTLLNLHSVQAVPSGMTEHVVPQPSQLATVLLLASLLLSMSCNSSLTNPLNRLSTALTNTSAERHSRVGATALLQAYDFPEMQSTV
jgi:hypothetical protein